MTDSRQHLADKRAQLQEVIRNRGNELSVFPLSFGEERLWFLDQLQGEATVYNMLSATRLMGELDVGALRESLERMVERHEILRTSFPCVEGQPVQLVSGRGQVKLEVEDISGGCEEEMRRRIEEERRERFDLARGPLMRARLLRVGDEEHVLVVVKHHIISDDWSMGIVLREMSRGYEALVEGREWPYGELEVQYGDFACWQRERMKGERLEGELKYWRERLRGIKEVMELPWERRRPAVQSFRGGRLRVEVKGGLVEGLRRVGQRIGATLFMTMLTGWQVLLSRYSNEEDIAVGTPVANRTKEELEGLIGLFVNTVVMRTDLSGNPRYEEALERVREVCVGAYGNQEVPFERVVEEMKPERRLSHTPMFQVMLAMQNTPKPEQETGGLRMRGVGVESEAAPFDLLLSLNERGDGGLEGMMNYSGDVFSEEGMKRMRRHWLKLLEGIVERPDRRIWELPLMDEEERREMVGYEKGEEGEVEWGDWVRRFEERVEEEGEATAVEGERKYSYRELNERANRIAGWLVAEGIGAEKVVVIAVERSIEFVASVIGIWKSGAAAAPLDMKWPAERRKRMVADVGAAAVIGRRDMEEECVEGVKTLWVTGEEEEEEALGGYSTANPPCSIHPQQLAYVLYTSGSSGRPKGVMINHGAFANYIEWCLQAYELGEGCGSLVHSSVTFDLTMTSIFAPLLAGKPLYIVPEQDGLDGLCKALASRSNLTFLKLTPSHLEIAGAILHAEEIRKCTRVLILGGEALSYELLANWRKQAPGMRIINEYGPTETTVGCCVYEIGVEDADRLVPIGRPITNMRLYILDGQLLRVPVGLFGEIFIAGPSVGRGYRNAPGLTADQFIPDPFAEREGERMYRSGDIARYLADGSIEFIGRRDSQVKIRGFRVELGEIEMTMLRHPNVRQAVVVVCADADSQKRLVGYVVPGDASLNTEEVFEYLRRELPDYMVPAAIVALEALPLTQNGKVDRQHLPSPQPSAAEERVPPRNEIEKQIAAIWRQVLNTEDVGIDDTFFELGGNSLKLVKVHVKLKEQFGCAIPLSDLFRFPTIALLARVLGGGDSGDNENIEQASADDRAQKQIRAINARRQSFAKKSVTTD